MTDKPKINGMSPDYIQIDEQSFFLKDGKWNCFCGVTGNGFEAMCEHASTHIEASGVLTLNVEAGDFSIKEGE